jgi:hypothetical protein
MKKRKVKDGGGAEADIYYIQSSGNQAFHQRITESRRAEAAIPAHDDLVLLKSREIGGEAPAEKIHHLIRQIDINHTPNVVLAKNPGIHEGPFLKMTK